MSTAAHSANYRRRMKQRDVTLIEQIQILADKVTSLEAKLVELVAKSDVTLIEQKQEVRQSGGRARVEDESLGLESSGTKEESKKEKSQKERKLAASLEFERFWRAYPSRRPYPNSKKAAADKFDVAVRHGADPELLIAAAERYARLCRGRDPQYVVQTTRWFNEKRWEDEIQALRRSEPVHHYPIGMS